MTFPRFADNTPPSRNAPTKATMFHAEIEATNHCNTRCLHCPHETMSRERGRMSWETFETIIQKIRAHAGGERFSLSFSGMGEPLLHPLLPRFIAHVSREAFTGFACNGAALTEQNVRTLQAAGLDVIYLSFNGDEPALYERMMGGIKFDRVLGHLRRAVALARGTRLQINANVSVTRANRHRLTQVRQLLNDEGVVQITFSMCHSRGGNLRDPDVIYTPPMPDDPGHCEVIKHTLFVDWRGRAHICDHDLHDEHLLGDLTTEPLETVLARRQQLIDHGLPFKMCHDCTDLLKGGFHLFQNDVGGRLPEWVYELFKDPDAAGPLSEATSALKWIYRIYEQHGRVDRFANKLLAIEKILQADLARERAAHAALRTEIEQWKREVSVLAETVRELDETRDRLARCDAELAALRADPGWRALETARRIGARLARQDASALAEPQPATI